VKDAEDGVHTACRVMMRTRRVIPINRRRRKEEEGRQGCWKVNRNKVNEDPSLGEGSERRVGRGGKGRTRCWWLGRRERERRLIGHTRMIITQCRHCDHT
jgi:hypothetical protein